jgi:hypothetical protein
MPRLLTASIASALLVVLCVPAALAAKPTNTCGAGASGYFLVDRDIWWDITVAGFEAEGIDVYEADGSTFTAEFDQFAADLGFGSGAGLEEFVRVDQWAGIDHNDNDLVCMKRRPITPGNPAFFFNGVDDQASSPHGDTDLGED